MSATSSETISRILVEETGLKIAQVLQTVALLEEGASVPFIARYRKEATGELDEVEIRLVQERLEYHTALNERRQTILKSIEEQGKLTVELRQKIEAAQYLGDANSLRALSLLQEIRRGDPAREGTGGVGDRRGHAASPHADG